MRLTSMVGLGMGLMIGSLSGLLVSVPFALYECMVGSVVTFAGLLIYRKKERETVGYNENTPEPNLPKEVETEDHKQWVALNQGLEAIQVMAEYEKEYGKMPMDLGRLGFWWWFWVRGGKRYFEDLGMFSQGYGTAMKVAAERLKRWK